MMGRYISKKKQQEIWFAELLVRVYSGEGEFLYSRDSEHEIYRERDDLRAEGLIFRTVQEWKQLTESPKGRVSAPWRTRVLVILRTYDQERVLLTSAWFVGESGIFETYKFIRIWRPIYLKKLWNLESVEP